MVVEDAKDLLPSLSSEEEAPSGSPAWKDAQGQRRSKVPAIRYPSNDCILYLGRVLDDDGEVQVEGDPYPLHVDEWVELRPILTVKVQLELLKVTGESSAESLMKVSEMLADRITAWNWTNLEYETLPNPPSADDLLNLSNDEWLYLIGLLSKGIAGTGSSKNA